MIGEGCGFESVRQHKLREARAEDVEVRRIASRLPYLREVAAPSAGFAHTPVRP